MAAKKAVKRKKAATKRASTGAAPEARKEEMKRGSKVSSMAVNREHLFALRPRVSSAFRQEDFIAARRLLEDEAYTSIEEAARAVAERALSLSNDLKGKRDLRLGR